MKKGIKYGLVAGITMASFCLAPVPATYAISDESECENITSSEVEMNTETNAEANTCENTSSESGDGDGEEYGDEEYEWEYGQVSILSGDAQTYTKGSSKGVSVRVDADPADLFDVWIMTDLDWEDPNFVGYDVTEGGLVEGRDFTISNGSTILTLTPSFLDSLAAGDWIWGMEFLGGSAVGTLTISGTTATTTVTTASATSDGVSASGVSAPKTGAGIASEEADGVVANGTVATIVSTISAAMIAAVAVIRKKASRES